MRIRWIIRLLSVCSCAAVLAAEAPSQPAGNSRLRLFPYMRTAKPQDPAALRNGAWGKIELDPLLYAHTADLQTDLLLTDPDGVELPFAVGKETAPGTRQKETPVPGRITGITPLPDGRTAIEYTLDAPAELSGIEFIRDNRPFRRTLSIEVDRDGHWITALAGQTITDCPGFPEPVRRRLVFSRSYRTGKLRILIGNPNGGKPESGNAPVLTAPGAGFADASGVELEEIRAISIETYPVEDRPVTEEYALTLLNRIRQEDREITILGSRREPLTAIRVSYPEPRYQRRAEIAGSDDGKHWIPLTGATLRKLDSELLDKIEFPVSRYRRYRLTVIAEDGSHFRVAPTITASGVRYFLAVSAPLPESLRLYYGGRLKAVESSDAALPQSFRKLRSPVPFQLAAPLPNPAASNAPAAVPAIKWLLPLLILLALLLLLPLLRNALRHTAKKIPDDSE